MHTEDLNNLFVTHIFYKVFSNIHRKFYEYIDLFHILHVVNNPKTNK